MAKMTQGIKGTKSRVLLVLLGVIVVIIGVAVVIWALKKRSAELEHVQANVKRLPSIEALPGVGTSTAVHGKLLREQNLAQAQKAAKTGTSFVPTITSKSYVGKPVQVPELGIQIPGTPSTAGCDPTELERARLAGVKVDELRCKGCSSAQLHAAGYTAGELMIAGLSAADLREGGYTAAELNAAGFSAADLADAGYPANELNEGGFTAAQLKATKKFDAKILKEVGYKSNEIKEAGFSAAELKIAGYTPSELKSGGYTASEAKKAGFSAPELKNAGYSAQELVEAGFSDSDLAKATLSPHDIKTARAAAGPIDKMPKDCNVSALSSARSKGFTASTIKQKLNCPPAAMMDAGFTGQDLLGAQYVPKDLKIAGFSPVELKAGGVESKQIREAGFTSGELKSSGFTAGELIKAGYTPSELAQAGFSAGELRAAGLAPSELKTAGFKAADLQAAGYSTGELVRAGFTPEAVSPPPGISPIKTPLATPAKPAEVTPTTRPLPPPPATTASAVAQAAQKAAQSVAGVAPATAEVQRLERSVTATAPVSQSTITAAVPPAVPRQEAKEEKLLEQLQERQSKGLSQQQRGEMSNKIEASMAAQANQLIASWTPPPNQQFVPGQAMKEGATTMPAGTAAGGVGVVNGGSALEEGAVGGGPGSTVIKAGDVMFGVLDTGINSDEQSPILATIVQGPLKGARLLGQFSRAGKKVVLSFTTMSLKAIPRSIGINAVAIDPDTARTALASEVNNHYMLRYGTLFASSFVAGLAQAIAQSGSTVVSEPFGQAIIQNPTLSAADKGLIALGNVGTQYAGVLRQNFNTPPTITVDSGEGIGILFMADLTVPSPASGAGAVEAVR